VDSVPVRHIHFPLTDVTVSVIIFPDSVALLLTIHPIAIVGVPIDPGVETFAADFSFGVITQIGISITEAFITTAMPLIMKPASLVVSAVVVRADSQALSLSILYVTLTRIERVLVVLDDVVLGILYFFVIEQFSDHLECDDFRVYRPLTVFEHLHHTLFELLVLTETQ